MDCNQCVVFSHQLTLTINTFHLVNSIDGHRCEEAEITSHKNHPGVFESLD